jgi:hypothetical protein
VAREIRRELELPGNQALAIDYGSSVFCSVAAFAFTVLATTLPPRVSAPKLS